MKNKHVQIRNKKYLIFIIVLLIFISIFIINLLRHNSSADYSNRQIRQNLSAISTFDYSKVSTIEDKIRKLEITEAKGTFDVTKKLTPEQYKKIFSTSVIMGDSVTEGIVAYGYLGEDHVFCKIGASIINGDEIFSSASKTYPGFAFCAFGMNDMGNYNGDSSAFIQKYKTLIKEFKKLLRIRSFWLTEFQRRPKRRLQQSRFWQNTRSSIMRLNPCVKI